MIERCLLIHEVEDFAKVAKRHYSSTKGFLFAQGISNNIESFYLTTGESEIADGVNLISIEEIKNHGFEYFDLIIITREMVFSKLDETFPNLFEFMMDSDRKNIICHKGDSFGWIKDKKFRKSFTDRTGKMLFKEVSKMFDIVCAQTQPLADLSNKGLPEKVTESIRSNIFISRMGVPDSNPYKNRDKNDIQIYDNDHKYCVDYWMHLKEGRALKPLCFTEKHISFSKANLEKYQSKKIKIIYMGRIKIDDGNILYLMKDIMMELGPDYELHIYPGRFVLPDVPISVLSPKFPINIQMIRDRHFAECTNVILHYPFDAKNKADILGSMDLGLDFSQARPKNEISFMGNAKLLEYCYYGLKVITEKNVYNSNIVLNSGSGIALEGIANSEDYVKGIKKITLSKTNWNAVSSYVRNNHGWNIISLELLQHAQEKYSLKNNCN